MQVPIQFQTLFFFHFTIKDDVCNHPEMASSHPACSGHIQNGSKCPKSKTPYVVSTFLLSKQPPKWCVYVLGFWSSSIFFRNWIAISQKNQAEKHIFSLDLHTSKNVIFATRLPFLNRQLLLNYTFQSSRKEKVVLGFAIDSLPVGLSPIESIGDEDTRWRKCSLNNVTRLVYFRLYFLVCYKKSRFDFDDEL